MDGFEREKDMIPIIFFLHLLFSFELLVFYSFFAM